MDFTVKKIKITMRGILNHYDLENRKIDAFLSDETAVESVFLESFLHIPMARGAGWHQALRAELRSRYAHHTKMLVHKNSIQTFVFEPNHEVAGLELSENGDEGSITLTEEFSKVHGLGNPKISFSFEAIKPSKGVKIKIGFIEADGKTLVAEKTLKTIKTVGTAAHKTLINPASILKLIKAEIDAQPCNVLANKIQAARVAHDAYQVAMSDVHKAAEILSDRS